MPIPHLQQLAGREDGSRSGQQDGRPPPPLACPCNRHVIDTHGDLFHTCKKRTGSTKDAHERILDALEKICHDSGLSTQRHNIPLVQTANGKIGRGDLVIKDANLGDCRNVIAGSRGLTGGGGRQSSACLRAWT